jgi:hypothetical protein
MFILITILRLAAEIWSITCYFLGCSDSAQPLHQRLTPNTTVQRRGSLTE